MKTVSTLLLLLMAFICTAQIGPQPPAVYYMNSSISYNGSYGHFEVIGVAPKGLSDLQEQIILIGDPNDPSGNYCYVMLYQRNLVLLLNDAHDNWLGWLPVGGSYGTIENLHCIVDMANTSYVTQGTTGATFKMNATLKPIMNGQRGIWGFYGDANWQSGTNLDYSHGWFLGGSFTVAQPPPPPLLSGKDSIDTSVGLLFASNTTFPTAGKVGNWAIYAGTNSNTNVSGHWLTPVLFNTSGYTVKGVGTPRQIGASSLGYTWEFGLTSGSDMVSTGDSWGWFDGNALTGATNSGTIGFNRVTDTGVRFFTTSLLSIGSGHTTNYNLAGYNDGNSWTGGRLYSIMFSNPSNTPAPPSITLVSSASTTPVYVPDAFTGTLRPAATNDNPRQVAYIDGGPWVVQAGQSLTLKVKNALPNQQVWARVWMENPIYNSPNSPVRFAYSKPRLANTPIAIYVPQAHVRLSGGWLVGTTDGAGNFSLPMGAEYFGAFSLTVYVGNMGTNGGGTPPSDPGAPTGPASDGFIMSLPRTNFVNAVHYWSQNASGIPAAPSVP